MAKGCRRLWVPRHGLAVGPWRPLALVVRGAPCSWPGPPLAVLPGPSASVCYCLNRGLTAERVTGGDTGLRVLQRDLKGA